MRSLILIATLLALVLLALALLAPAPALALPTMPARATIAADGAAVVTADAPPGAASICARRWRFDVDLACAPSGEAIRLARPSVEIWVEAIDDGGAIIAHAIVTPQHVVLLPAIIR